MAVQLHARVLRRLARQDAELHLCGDLQLLLQPGQAVLGDERLAQLLHHAGEALVLVDEAARQLVHHPRKLAQLLLIAAPGLEIERLVRGLGQRLQLGAQQALLAAAHALAQRARGRQLLRIAAEGGHGLRDAPNLVIAAVGQVHAGVALGQGLQRVDGFFQRLQAAPQVPVQPQQHGQYQRCGAAQRQALQEAAGLGVLGVVGQRHQRARRMAGQVVHRHAADGVAARVQLQFGVLRTAQRHVRGRCLP